LTDVPTIGGVLKIEVVLALVASAGGADDSFAPSVETPGHALQAHNHRPGAIFRILPSTPRKSLI
jgi:hypothetical protein